MLKAECWFKNSKLSEICIFRPTDNEIVHIWFLATVIIFQKEQTGKKKNTWCFVNTSQKPR